MTWGKRSGRTTPLPPDWPTIRRRILDRDGEQCTATRGDTGQRCDARATDVDHIDGDTDHSDNNLRSLCGWHHSRITGSQGGRRVRQKARRPERKHPGLRN